MRTAAWNENAWRIPIAAEEDGERLGRGVVLPREEVRDERLRDESSAQAVEREQAAEPGDDPARAVERRARLGRQVVSDLDAVREPANRDEPRAGGERVAEEPLRRRPDEREQGAARAGERGDRVVRAEERRRVAALGGVGQHRLLERRERAGLDDVRGNGAGQRCGDERGQPPGQREDGAGDRHRYEQDPVAAAAADAVAVPREQNGDERIPGENGREDRSDRGIRIAAIRERDPDQHRAEPVRDGPHALGRDDPSSVAAHAPPACTSALHQA